MSEAVQKLAQVFKITLTHSQRQALFSMCKDMPAEKERDDRRRFKRALDAFELNILNDFVPLSDQPWTGVVTRENIDTMAKLVADSFRNFNWHSNNVVILDDVETLFEECKDGKHTVEITH